MSRNLIQRLYVFSYIGLGGLCGCGPVQLKDWSGDAIVLGSIKIITEDGRDFTNFCEGRESAIDDYVPERPYIYKGQSRDSFVNIKRFQKDGSYFAAATPGKLIHINLNCQQEISSSWTKATIYTAHINIGTFAAPNQKAISYFGHLIVYLKKDREVIIVLDESADDNVHKIPIPLSERQLPVIRVPLQSFGKPIGWDGGHTVTQIKIWFP